MYYTDFGQDYVDSEKKPWYQKYPLDPSFPFTLFRSSFKIYPFHWHKYMELVNIIKGRMDISIGSKNYTAKEGDIVVINPDLIHGYYNGSDDVYVLVYLFGPELFEQSLVDLYEPLSKMAIFDRKTVFAQNDDGLLYSKVADILRLIEEEFFEKKEGYRVAIKKHFYDLALIYLRDIPKNHLLPGKAKKTNSNFQILERILSYIYDNYDNPEITLDSVAEIACLSKFYFSRFFRERTGFTFHTYLSRYRISKAQTLLSETEKTVIDIAYNCGFASLKTFNRLFKLYTGASPTAYRITSMACTNQEK